MDNVNIVAIILQLQNEEQDLPKYFSNLHLILLQYQQLFFNVIYFYFGLHLVFIVVRAFLQLQQAGATFQLQCASFLLWCLLSLWTMDSRTCRLQQMQLWGSASVACGIFADQGLNPCLLHWQVDSLSLSHQESPQTILKLLKMCFSLNQTNGLQPQTKDFHNYAQWRSVSQGLQSRVRSEFWVSHLTSTRTASHIMHL